MKTTKKLKWIFGTGFFIFLAIEKLNYFEGFPTNESAIFGIIKGIMLVLFVAVFLVEIKNKDDKK